MGRPIKNTVRSKEEETYKVLIDLLKTEEHKQFKDKRRVRTEYSANITASLQLSCSDKQLYSSDTSIEELFSISATNIKEHANRRVDLFFFTLVAYYGTDLIPTMGHTDLQHGIGRGAESSRTQACHSSLTPSLIDKTILQKNGSKSLLSRTSLSDSLNSTVELPFLVNHLDGIIEEKFRPFCLKILANVAMKKLNPIEGLSLFLNVMHHFLHEVKHSVEDKISSPFCKSSLFKKELISPKLLDLIIAGTLHTTFSEKTKKPLDEYLLLLLRVKPEEHALCKNNKALYEEKILALQREIVSSKAVDLAP